MQNEVDSAYTMDVASSNGGRRGGLAPGLIWESTFTYLRRRMAEGSSPVLIISPFITLDALRGLLDTYHDLPSLRVITRWNADDLLSGVSDTAVYPFLRNLRVPLYLHNSIHLKLYVFQTGVALHTSANVTRKGFGLAKNANVETGSMVELLPEDWRHLYALLQESLCVNDEVYECAQRYIAENKKALPPVPEIQYPQISSAEFSRLSLPASPNPDHLYAFYVNPTVPGLGGSVSEFIHDLFLYDIPAGLERGAFFDLLAKRFRAHPFVQAVVDLIKQHGQARFGLVNAWLQDNCSDKPTPYKWELKRNTRILYDWLSFFYSEVSWDQPRHSMLLRWTSPDAGKKN